jgi:hypothetical protein
MPESVAPLSEGDGSTGRREDRAYDLLVRGRFKRIGTAGEAVKIDSPDVKSRIPSKLSYLLMNS